jgi:mannitol/fructose-specific phosphotransferase system IIA component (Ntr-type)
MNKFIDRPKEWKLENLLNTRLFIPDMKATTREEAIRELARPAAEAAGLAADVVAKAVVAREQIMGTSLGVEIAVPHARLEGVSRPILVVGHSRQGIDFDSPDGRPTRLVFLLLTPEQEMSAQVQIMGQIARLFKNEQARAVVYESDSVELVRAFIKAETAPVPVH